jgi:hypothetical protein
MKYIQGQYFTSYNNYGTELCLLQDVRRVLKVAAIKEAVKACTV